MNRCHCLVSERKQCTREPSRKPGDDPRFCWQHQKCADMVVATKGSPMPSPAPSPKISKGTINVKNLEKFLLDEDILDPLIADKCPQIVNAIAENLYKDFQNLEKNKQKAEKETGFDPAEYEVEHQSDQRSTLWRAFLAPGFVDLDQGDIADKIDYYIDEHNLIEKAIKAYKSDKSLNKAL